MLRSAPNPAKPRLPLMNNATIYLIMFELLGLTMELSHAGPRTQANLRLPGRPETLPGVGCSDLVRQANVHHSKISGPSLWAETQRRPAMSLSRKCNRETRETHEKK